MLKEKESLRSRQFKEIVIDFGIWLDVLRYSESVKYEYPRNLECFFGFLEERNIVGVGRITKDAVTAYHQYLKERDNIRRGGHLGKHHINAHLNAIRKLADYLYKTQGRIIPVEHIRPERIIKQEREVLTRGEVESLFGAIKNDSRYALRDRAWLSVYYGCGLRRNEGICLGVKDIDFVRGFIHVKEGKGFKERFVPMTNKVAEHLKKYIKKGRPLFVKSRYNSRLFLNYRGHPINSFSIYKRLKLLQEKSECDSLKQKQIGLHTLRHSIATHLLQENLPLETIATFLGHSTLESTQIYTHIEEEYALRV